MKKLSLLIGIATTSLFYSQTLTTQTRDDAGTPTNQSGFYETNNPSNYPGTGGWWHLLDVRHTNTTNNFGMQFSGRFDDQDLWFRKTAGIGNQDWKRVVMETTAGNVEIAKWPSTGKLTVYNNNGGASGSNQFELRTNLTRNSDHYFIKNITNGAATDDVTFSLRHDGQMFVDGNVGIGVTNPTEKLSVDGIIQSTKASEIGGTLELKNPTKTGANVAQMWRLYNTTGAYGNSLQFWPYNNSGQFFNPTGYVFKISDTGNAALQGKFEAKEIKVTLTPTADFVFAEDYSLPKLEDVEKHIKEKKHLPEVASAKEMEKEGVNVGEFQIKLLQKIEELTLYTIEQNKLIKEQQKRIEALENKNK